MYRQASQRRLLVQRITVYGVMVIATLGLVTALIFVLQGYQFNRTAGRIEQGGLVQFESMPTGAQVVVDGDKLSNRTITKASLAPGQHAVRMEKDGYRVWQKTVNVSGGNILWINYARLIPRQIAPSNVADLTHVSSTAASPDGKWIAIKEDAATPMIRLADISQDDIKLSTLEIDDSSFSQPAIGKTQSFTIEKWDPTSRTILVRHVYDDNKMEWLVVGVQSANNTKNITSLLGINASKVVFSRNTTVLYVLAEGVIRKVDLAAATLSGPLVSNVADFSLNDRATLVYITTPEVVTKQRTVGYLEEDTAKPYTLRSYSDNGAIRAQIGKYFNKTFVAIAHNDTLEVMVGDLPKNTGADVATTMRNVETAKLAGEVQFLSTKNDDRFVVVQAGATYTVYDLELQQTTTTTLKEAVNITKEFGWVDDYTLYSDASGTLRFYEFDGANQQDIMAVAPGFSVAISSNGKYVYGIIKNTLGESFHLTRAPLLL